MRCFVHSNIEAVGTCRNCQRGLCNDCATEVDKVLACKDRCEAEVRDQQRLSAWSMKVVDSSPPNTMAGRNFMQRSSALNLVLGIVFLAWGTWGDPFSWLLVVLGMCFLSFGIVELVIGATRNRNP